MHEGLVPLKATQDGTTSLIHPHEQQSFAPLAKLLSHTGFRGWKFVLQISPYISRTGMAQAWTVPYHTSNNRENEFIWEIQNTFWIMTLPFYCIKRSLYHTLTIVTIMTIFLKKIKLQKIQNAGLKAILQVTKRTSRLDSSGTGYTEITFEANVYFSGTVEESGTAACATVIADWIC